jgi:protoheme IX farnesyltransferase
MERTKKRPSARGLISLKFAMVYALILGLIGLVTLYLGTNILTIIIAIMGLFTYVIAYSLWFKRKSIFGTLVGAISGAVPSIIGYTATNNRFDLVSLTIFIILFCWQIPHFFAIAIYRRDDYAAANIPVLPLERSMLYSQINTLIFTILYFIATIVLPLTTRMHSSYIIIACVSGIAWTVLSIKGFTTKNKGQWARKMFVLSILNITLLNVSMMI